MSSVAAVDYGRRRIGLAISDPLRITVNGLDTVLVPGRPDLRAAAERVAEALAPHEPGLIVVGLPLYQSGDESEMSLEAREFGAALGNTAGAPIDYYDEGLTSWAAEKALKERGVDLRKARKTGEIDREAACGLLRAWLRDHS